MKKSPFLLLIVFLSALALSCRGVYAVNAGFADTGAGTSAPADGTAPAGEATR